MTPCSGISNETPYTFLTMVTLLMTIRQTFLFSETETMKTTGTRTPILAYIHRLVFT